MDDTTLPKNLTKGQRYALLILSGGGAMRGAETCGGEPPPERRVHANVADWLVQHALAIDSEGGMVRLTEAGEEAARRTHESVS